MPTDRPDKDRPPSGAGDRRNTLRLTPRDLGTLLDRFDASEAAKANANREFIRWPFRYDAIQMVAQPLGGGVSKVTMACRNISRTGMSLLHSSFMHPGTKCTVLLPRPGRTEVPVRGWVAHCNHRSGMVHEIGINFTEPIEIREFIRPDPFADWFSLERIKPEDLTGCVLYVDDSEMDVRIVKHFLRGTCLSVRTASSSAAAVAALETQPDLIISDFMLGDGTGFDVMTSVRQRGYRGPFVLATSDTGEAARKAIAAHQPDACLAKPFKQDVLHRAIGEFLLVRRRPAGGQARRRSGPGDRGARPDLCRDVEAHDRPHRGGDQIGQHGPGPDRLPPDCGNSADAGLHGVGGGRAGHGPDPLGVQEPGRQRQGLEGPDRRVRAHQGALRRVTGLKRGKRVANGTRTRDPRDHNPVLYQLSYDHRDAAPIQVRGDGSTIRPDA